LLVRINPVDTEVLHEVRSKILYEMLSEYTYIYIYIYVPV